MNFDAATIGFVGGLVGTAAGIAGFVLAILSYRRVSKLKTLDLRIEVNRARNDAHVRVVKLGDLQESAVKSRKAVAAAIGKLNSGDMVNWQARWDQDQSRITELASQVPSTDETYEGLNATELERKLIELDRTIRWIQELTDAYEKDLAWDDEQRRQLREDIRTAQGRDNIHG